MSSDVAVRVEGLWKRYGPPWMRAARRALGLTRPGDAHWALRDVSLEILRGESFGVIGDNGAGKSTLLKALAGVTPATRGVIDVRGRLFPMIELNAGLHRELTGRENIMLLGAIMGMGRGDMRARMSAIEEFCELGEWIERPVRTYSSGMLARLGFSVAMNVEADILLIDEVLAVGDTGFSRKCYEELQRRSAAGVTVVLVSHNVRQVERLCDRAALLRGGEIAFEGPPVEAVTHFYNGLSSNGRGDEGGASGGPLRDRLHAAPTSGELRVIRAELADSVATLDALHLELEIEVFDPEVEVEIAVAINNFEMQSVFAFTSRNRLDAVLEEGSQLVRCTIPSLNLRPGHYGLGFKIRGKADHNIQEFKNLMTFEVVADPERSRELEGTSGLAYTAHEWSVAPLTRAGR
jgi:lipopolysaccharide transport system ATP-binding protein